MRQYGANAKRMRVGTKSCTQCRRRKIRCTLQPGNTTCDSCIAHETPCQAQRPKTAYGISTHREVGADDETISSRLDELEELVSQLQADPHSTKASTAHPASAREPARQQPGPSHPETCSTSAWNQSALTTCSAGTSVSPGAPGGALESLASTGAPLLGFFQDANLIQEGERVRQHTPPLVSSQKRERELINSLITLLPDRVTLLGVLTESSPYWCTWPPCYHGEDATEILRPGDEAKAIEFIYGCFQLQKPALVAKAMLFLGLCLQQLPKNSPLLMRLPPPNTLVDEYIEICSTLIFIGAETSRDMDDLEARMTLYQLCINLGKPRRSWTTIRGAMESAMLQSIHRFDKRSTMKQKYLWETMWHCDRQSAAVLGMPAFIPNTHPAVGLSPLGDSVTEKISHLIFRLVGDVIERDQTHSLNPNYATTVQLDQDCAAIRPMMPAEWFDPALQTDMSMETFYHTQCLKMKYYMLIKEIHLPWMLKSTCEPRYQHSRATTLETARNFITSYVIVRQNPMTKGLNCAFMDFEAFSAAVILIVGILTRPAMTRDAASEIGDWMHVNKTTQCLAQTAERIECSIATQGVHVLEYLIKACRGDADIPEKFEAAIPFFGQVRINRVAASTPTLQEAPSATETASSADWGNTIELSANSFGYSNVPAEFGFGAELGADWMGHVDFNVTYDWTQTFGQADFENLTMSGL